MRRLRTLLTTYREAGGTQPVVLFHDGEHGAPLIDALARYGDGLPAHVAAGCGQRSDAGRTRDASPRPSPTAPRRCVCCCGANRSTTSPALHRNARAAPSRSSPARLRCGPRRADRDRRSRRARRSAARDRARRRRAAPGELPADRRQARRAAARLARAARRRAGAGRRRRAAGAARRSARSRSMSKAARSVSPASRPARPARSRRRSRPADAALRRGRLRAMRAVQGDLPGEGDHAGAAARFPRRHRAPRAC